jgi:hypothetical protein
MDAYGIATLFPEYWKIRDVSEVVSTRPAVPVFTPGRVPPMYVACPSSRAAIGNDKATTQQSIKIRFIPAPPHLYK